ncbi:MAG: hypothetical protein IPH89_05135 [Bacteroidetes bacterium]|nr:hypothetical protein [Bacteroidota bacterium]
MKNFFLIVFTFIIATASFAGNGNNDAEKNTTKLVSGKIIDKVSGEEIAGAEIKIGEQIVYSDLNGNFSASINIAKTEAQISFISYAETKININPYSYTPLVIELEQQ